MTSSIAAGPRRPAGTVPSLFLAAGGMFKATPPREDGSQSLRTPNTHAPRIGAALDSCVYGGGGGIRRRWGAGGAAVQRIRRRMAMTRCPAAAAAARRAGPMKASFFGGASGREP